MEVGMIKLMVGVSDDLLLSPQNCSEQMMT